MARTPTSATDRKEELKERSRELRERSRRLVDRSRKLLLSTRPPRTKNDESRPVALNQPARQP